MNADLVTKRNIKGLTLDQLTALMLEIGEKPFHARQIYQWMYQKGVRDFQEMTNLSNDLRNLLSESFSLNAVTLKAKESSRIDETVKYLFAMEDGLFVESVYMVEEKRVTVCLSTMIGCPIGCSYCATALMGFSRNLTAGEIVDQLTLINSLGKKPVTNVVFMGMGEPFLNYENVISAANILNSELGPAIAAKKITISTCGIVPAIYRFADDGHRFKLAVSLSAADDSKRNKLIPINRKYPLKELMKAIEYYTRKSKRRVTFEYILIKGFNDSPEDAHRIISLLGSLPCKLNLIPYNPNEYIGYKPPDESVVDRFIQEVYQSPFTVTVRRSKGSDISAACGQLYVREQKSNG
ncbi:MAG: 23S rRNA (adenine(2503)-C(2))-methyltransferase RlmN [Candidatus Marinimicrobia bacterium CG08_land_8_20_14_0_20_45_22]|nr:MAG: 23S rRNA (adenine(2503)-C(2))-methyltransferase RlmN [Candidatus Marinimicrobia bacterium CG08_land_8_20_14_0_20_45_22]